MKSILLLLILPGILMALSLTQLWTFNTNDTVEGLAFSKDGYLGVASRNSCAYVLDQNGNLVSKKCGNSTMHDASYCCGKFGFINGDDYAYIYDLETGEWKKVYVGDYVEGAHTQSITVLEDGFLAGYTRLAYFYFNGTKKWDVDIWYIENGPAVYKGYVYVPRSSWPSCCEGALTILNLSNGSEVGTSKFSERVGPVWDVQVCENYLALRTAHYVYLYDISYPTVPRLLWSYNENATASQIAFSPECKYLVSTDASDKKIHIFDVQTGEQVLEKKLEDYVYSVAWWQNRIAVGLWNNTVIVYRVEENASSLSITTTAPETPANTNPPLTYTTTSLTNNTTTTTTTTSTTTAQGIPAPVLLATLGRALLGRRKRE